MKKQNRKLRKSDRIYLIYQELLSHLGNSKPRVEILSLAQKLVELSHRDRRREIDHMIKPLGRENYYARDVYKMVEHSPWLTLSKEYNRINEFN